MQTPDVLVTGIVFGEQPRWHDGRLWFSDWGTQEVIAVDPDGTTEVIHRGSSFPLCVDWLPDGRLLVVDTSTGRLLVQAADGSLEVYADRQRQVGQGDDDEAAASALRDLSAETDSWAYRLSPPAQATVLSVIEKSNDRTAWRSTCTSSHVRPT